MIQTRAGPHAWTRPVIAAAGMLVLSSCDRPAELRVDFMVTHTDQVPDAGSILLALPPAPAVVEAGAGAVSARGVIAAPDECDDLRASVEPDDSLLILRIVVQGSRRHPGACEGPGGFALFQWQARIEPIEPGQLRVQIIYDYRGLRAHSASGSDTGRYASLDRIVADQTVTVK
ncbi:MAG TPA: hypothetical protein VLK84_01410 [Longimicrobium sp.]|nr:hypothetical protein [Longimicrobium sp.]